jgi:small-conductance mechanosensitive channel
MSFLDSTFYNNTVQEWLVAAGILVLALFILRFLVGMAVKRLAPLADQTDTPVDDLVAELLGKTRFLFLLIVSLFLSSHALTLPAVIRTVLLRASIIALVLQGAIWVNAAINFLLERYRKAKLEQDASAVTTVTALSFIGKLAVWVIAILLIMDNFGIEVTALVAGMGIGGIAVALAAQSILSDLFASLAIVLDKPFVIGDFLAVGEYKGTVEYIGLKTTRLRSLTGEQLVLGNADLLNSRVRNFGRLYERRMAFTIGVTYQTPRESIERIPQMLREAVEGQETVRFDRSHFTGYGDSSIDFDTVYFVLRPEYAAAMDIQQAINLEIHQRFEADGIEFAYPTRTVHLQAASEGTQGAEIR